MLRYCLGAVCPATISMTLPQYTSGAVNEAVSEFIQRLGLPARDLSIYIQAVTHRSFLNENPDVLHDNERLEFLGDAVLDFMVGAWVFENQPDMDEGALTRLRSHLVCNERLAELARQIGLGGVLRMGRGESASGGRAREGNLGSALEALIGAIYLDLGLEAVRKFVKPLFQAGSAAASLQLTDSKSRLQEWAQSKGLGAPRYTTVHSSGPDHAKLFEVQASVGTQVVGSGRGPSKQAAEEAAATEAVNTLIADSHRSGVRGAAG